jgi:molybdopterin/thiamine biosynthesis adenylyltransferase
MLDSCETEYGKLSRYLERTKRNHFWVHGPDGQLEIKKLKIGVAGLGGMGSNIAEILVRLGVVNLNLADPDTIDFSNLNRQVIANLETVGMFKADASVKELLSLEKDLNLKVFRSGVHQENVQEFVQGNDIVINEIDVLHIDKHLLLLEEARRQNVAVYTVLVVGLGVHLYKFDPASDFTPRRFLGGLAHTMDIDQLIKTFGEPLPSYLTGETLGFFKDEVRKNGVPIFGASTYLGQSLLVIRALADCGVIYQASGLAKTPCLPEFLVLDPLLMQMKVAVIDESGTVSFKT